MLPHFFKKKNSLSNQSHQENFDAFQVKVFFILYLVTFRYNNLTECFAKFKIDVTTNYNFCFSEHCDAARKQKERGKWQCIERP